MYSRRSVRLAGRVDLDRKATVERALWPVPVSRAGPSVELHEYTEAPAGGVDAGRGSANGSVCDCRGDAIDHDGDVHGRGSSEWVLQRGGGGGDGFWKS